jgi:hypothetical protein
MIGTTSYGFRYLLMDERLAPPLERIVDETRGMGQKGVHAELACSQWSARLFLENRVPATGCRDADIAADRRWLSESLGNLRSLL